MIEINNYHEEIFEKFLQEYSLKSGKDVENTRDEISKREPVNHFCPCIEVHFKDGKIYTVIRATEISITWSEGNNFYPTQSGYNNKTSK